MPAPDVATIAEYYRGYEGVLFGALCRKYVAPSLAAMRGVRALQRRWRRRRASRVVDRHLRTRRALDADWVFVCGPDA